VDSPFELGVAYSKKDVGATLGGGNLQSGIVYGKNRPDLVAIFTGGRHSTVSGYPDDWLSDGSIRYCGQGSRGDQKIAGANKVLADPARTVLVFKRADLEARAREKLYHFIGEYLVVGHEVISGLESRKSDKLLIFLLAPVKKSITSAIPSKLSLDLHALRARAISASRDRVPPKPTLTQYRERSRAIREYVLARASGICERCLRPAPFKTAAGSPYLEAHHTRRLADDGPDDILFVAGICANCHREAHLGISKDNFRQELEKRIADKERRDSE